MRPEAAAATFSSKESNSMPFWSKALKCRTRMNGHVAIVVIDSQLALKKAGSDEFSACRRPRRSQVTTPLSIHLPSGQARCVVRVYVPVQVDVDMVLFE